MNNSLKQTHSKLLQISLFPFYIIAVYISQSQLFVIPIHSLVISKCLFSVSNVALSEDFFISYMDEINKIFFDLFVLNHSV